jgi:hypothetical protein
MILMTRKKITGSFKRRKTPLKLKSSRYWVIATMKMIINMKMNINLRTLWEELSRRILLEQGSTSRPVMVGIGTLDREGSSNSLIKCKLAAVPYSYNKFKMIVIWAIRGNLLMTSSSPAQEKRLKGKYFACPQKSKLRLLSNIRMSRNKLRR